MCGIAQDEVHQATKEAFDLAFCIWAVPLQGLVHQEDGVQIDVAQLKKAFGAAAASPQKDSQPSAL